MEESINKSFLFRYFHYDRLIDTLIFQLAVTPNASLSAIYIHLPTAGGILGPQVLSGLVLLSSEISFSRQLLRNIPGPERRGRTSKLKLKAQGLQRTPKARIWEIKHRHKKLITSQHSHEVWMSRCMVFSFFEKSSTTSSVSNRAAKDPSTI